MNRDYDINDVAAIFSDTMPLLDGIEFLEGLGIEVRDSEWNFRPIYEIIRDATVEGWRHCNPSSISRLYEALICLLSSSDGKDVLTQEDSSLDNFLTQFKVTSGCKTK